MPDYGCKKGAAPGDAFSFPFSDLCAWIPVGSRPRAARVSVTLSNAADLTSFNPMISEVPVIQRWQ